MTPREQHLEQARANRDFAEYLLRDHPAEPTAMQWAVTAAFYCAVHCMEAHLSTFGVRSRSHQQRDAHLADPLYGVPNDVHAAYEALKQYSHGARYYMRRFQSGMVRAIVLDRYLAKIATFVGL